MITANMTQEQVLKYCHPCKCDSCSHGCNFGSGFLTKENVKKMAELLKISESELKDRYLDEVDKFNTKLFRPKLEKYPYGKCKFFNSKEGCMVHNAKPMECKISMGCKDYGEDLSIWFMLNYFVNKRDPESIRQFASYLELGGKTLHGGHLNDMVPDKDKLKKILRRECN